MKSNLSIAIFFSILITGVLLTGCAGSKYKDGIYMEINTTKGLIVAKLEFEKTPMTVANFVGLAEGSIKNNAYPEGIPFFDGSVFHRVVENHVVQGGSPAVEKRNSLGYMYPNEIHQDMNHSKAGMLGIANGGYHTNGSQFYITLSDRSYLDGSYTVFGEVIQGLDVVFSIAQGDTMKTVRIVRLGSKAKNFKADTDTFNEMVEDAKERVKQEEIDKQNREAAYIETNYPNADSTVSGLKYVINQTGTGSKPSSGSIITVMYKGKFFDGREFYSTTEKGRPSFGTEAQFFEFSADSTINHAGFTESVLDMKKGEKRTVIIPANLAYGRRGFYSRSVPGKKRFVIPQDTNLIYEIELLDIRK